MKRILLIAIILFPLSLFAQQIERETNIIRDGDVLTLDVMSYSNPGKSGKGLCWDFSNVEESDKRHEITITQDSNDIYTLTDDSGLTYFQEKNDNLFIIGKESSLSKTSHSIPMLLMKFPLAFGDSISTIYKGNGVYCGDHLTKVEGIASIKADGLGVLCLNEGDTIYNVLRIHSIRTSSIVMDVDSFALDTMPKKLEIEDVYQWYAKGYRYPVYETYSNTCYDNLIPVSVLQRAYRFLPETQQLTLANDFLNEESRNNNTTRVNEGFSNGNGHSSSDNFHYELSVHGNVLSINYSSESDADITALVSDSQGIIYKRRDLSCSANQVCTLDIDCSGLHHGEYVLYINANGHIYNDKFRI